MDERLSGWVCEKIADFGFHSSFFGQQGGSYELQIKSLVARKSAESTSTEKAVTEIRNTKRWQ